MLRIEITPFLKFVIQHFLYLINLRITLYHAKSKMLMTHKCRKHSLRSLEINTIQWNINPSNITVIKKISNQFQSWIISKCKIFLRVECWYKFSECQNHTQQSFPALYKSYFRLKIKVFMNWGFLQSFFPRFSIII